VTLHRHVSTLIAGKSPRRLRDDPAQGQEFDAIGDARQSAAEAVGAHLVTGGAGFIGSHVCDRLLADGRRVVAVDDLSTGRTANLAEARKHRSRFTFHRLDVRDDELRSLFLRHQPEVVMHLAAQAGVRPSVRDPLNDAGINVLGLVNVPEAAAAAGRERP
jgi:UDP-glucose 4-epimerase